MRRWAFVIMAIASTLVLGALPAYTQRLRAGFSVEYGTATNAFGLSSASFAIPYQNNTSSDGVVSTDLEYLIARAGPIELGIALKGSFGFSSWNLGSPLFPGVSDGQGNYYYPDNVHISADWWAVAPLATAHVHLGPFVTLDGGLGYGPYGYFNVTYWDDAGVTSGPVFQESGFFPASAWGFDWSAGLSFGFFRIVSLGLDVGMTGPDFVTGLNVSFALGERYGRRFR
jgi:hypothetical protein